MGKSKKSKKSNTTQKHLEYGTLTANTLIEETKTTDTVITCVIRNYRELKTYVYYKSVAWRYSRKWILTLIRNSVKLFAFISTSALVDNIVIFFLRNNGEVLDSVLKAGCNFYVAELDEKQIKDDMLIIQCLYTARPYENTICLMPGLQQYNELKAMSDVDILFNDLKKMYLTGRFSDFTLRVGTTFIHTQFKVHKLILCRHSKYFARRITANPDWAGEDFKVEVVPAMMHEVLLYLYSGEMRNMHLDSMCEVYYIACTLEIASLQTICVHYFKSMFSVHNVKDFIDLALNQKHTDFLNEIMHFLEKQPQSVRHTKVWADVIEKVSNLQEEYKQKVIIKI